MPINFVMQGKCLFSDISRPACVFELQKSALGTTCNPLNLKILLLRFFFLCRELQNKGKCDNSSTFQGVWAIFKYFSRQNLVFKDFSRKLSFSSTFQACANPNHIQNVHFGRYIVKIYVQKSCFTALLMSHPKTKFPNVYPTIYLPK